MAADLSSRMGLIQEFDVERIRVLLDRAHLPVKLPGSLKPGQLLELMAVDKKARDGTVFLVLLQAIGHAFVTSQYDRESMQSTLNHFATCAEVS